MWSEFIASYPAGAFFVAYIGIILPFVVLLIITRDDRI